MFLHVSYIDDSLAARQRSDLAFWAVDTNIAANSTIESVLKLMEKKLNELPSPINCTVGDVVCIFKAGRWRRAKIVEATTNELGKVKTFLLDTGETCSTPLSYVRQLHQDTQQQRLIKNYPGHAVEHILADVVPPRSPGPEWSKLCMQFLKTEVEGKVWYADQDQTVLTTRLFHKDTKQPLACIMVERNLALPAQTYYHLARGLSPTNFSPGQHVYGNNQLPSASTLPAVFRQPNLPYTSPEELIEASLAGPAKSYTRKEFPSTGRHTVQLVSAPQGPWGFIIRLLSNEDDLDLLQSKLQTTPLRPYDRIPKLGTPCVILSCDGILYRGSVVSSQNANQHFIELIDYGRSELCDPTQLREIPDEFVRVPAFTYRVSIEDAEKMMLVKGLNETFSGIASNAQVLVAEAVRGIPNRVILYNQQGRSLRNILAEIFGFAGVSPSVRSPSPLPRLQPMKIDIPYDVSQVETVFVSRVDKPGSFFGILKKRSPSDLERMSMEMFALYEKEPSALLLYADAKSHVGQHGVIKTDNQYFRVRILQEMANEVRILLIDDGRETVISRCDLLAPLSTLSLFTFPAFGISCHIDNIQMSKAQWSTIILNREMEIRIDGIEDGVYNVSLTGSPINLLVSNMLSPMPQTQSSPIESMPPSPPSSDTENSPSSKSPTIQRVTSPVEEKSMPPSPPSSEERTTSPVEERPSSRNENRRVREGYANYQHPNAATRNSASKADRDTNWRSGNGQTQEVIRKPRGPPPTDANTRGPVGFVNGNHQKNAPQPSDSQVQKELSTPTALPAESPTPALQDDYVAQVVPQGMKSGQIVFVEGVDKFYVQLSEVYSDYEKLFSELQEYCSSSSQETIRNLQVGQPCAAKYTDESWYRGKVTAVNGEHAEVYFVDYGNSQKTLLSDIRALEKSFLNYQSQAYICRMAGCGFQHQFSESDKHKLDFYTGRELDVNFLVAGSDGKYPVRLFINENGIRRALNCNFGAPSVENAETLNVAYSHLKLSSSFSDFIIGAFYNVDRFYLRNSTFDEHKNEEAAFNEFYSSLASDELIESTPRIGLPVVVRNEEYQKYCRAQIKAVNIGLADVILVDYGTEQKIACIEMKRMLTNFISWPVQAWKCHLKGVKASPIFGPDREKLMSDCFDVGQLVKARLAFSVADDSFEAEILHSKYGDLVKHLLDHNLVELPAEPVEFATTLASQDLDAVTSKRHFENVVITYASSLSEFWVDLASEVVEEVMKEIEDLSLKLEFQNENTFKPEVGKVSLALYVRDRKWYRAVITEIDGEQATVHYVDYGNTALVSLADIRGLPKKCAREPRRTIKCCLQGAQDIPLDVRSEIGNVLEQTYSLEVVNRIGEVLIVKLKTVGGADVYEHLMSLSNQASRDAVTEEIIPELAVAEAPSEEIAHQEVIAPEATIRESAPQEGIIQDAVHRKNEPTEATVEKTFEEDFPKGSFFQETSEVFKSELKEQSSEIAYSRIAVDNVKGTLVKTPDSLEGQELDAYIVYFNSPGDLWIQPLKSLAENELRKAINSVYSSSNTDRYAIQGLPAVGEVYGVLHSEYNEWYRARINKIEGADINVLFIDYGDSTSVTIDRVRELPSELRLVPALAVHCALELPVEHDGWSKRSSDELNNFLTEPCRIRFGKQENGVYRIESLHCQEIDVAERIKSILTEDEIQVFEETPTRGRSVDVLTPVTERTEFESQSQATIEEHVMSQVITEEPLSITDTRDEQRYADRLSVFKVNLPSGAKLSTQAAVLEAISPEEVLLDMNGNNSKAVSDLLQELPVIETLPLVEPQIGRACLSLYPGDGSWYRAVINNVSENEATVLYVDYGNSAVVPFENLRRLPLSLAQSASGLACALDGINRNSSSESKDLSGLFEEGTLTVVLKNQTADRTFVRLFNKHGVDLNTKYGFPEVPSGPLLNQSLIKEVFGDVTMASVKIDDTRLEADKTVNDTILEEQLESFAPAAQVERVKTEPVDMGASTSSTADEPSPDEGSLSVQQPISCNLSQESELVVAAQREDQSATPAVVIHLRNAPQKAAKTVVDMDAAEEPVVDPDQTLVVDDIAVTYVPESVNLPFAASASEVEENSADIGKVATIEETASTTAEKHPIFDIGPSKEVCISFVASTTQFWIQYREDMDTYTVDDLLRYGEKVELVEKPLVGGMYAVYSTINEGWYRGIIKSLGKEHATVFYVDYGDTEIVSCENIRELPDNVSEIAPYAHKCNWLTLPKDPVLQTEAAVEAFATICEPTTYVKAIFITENKNGLSKVEALYKDGISVVDLIKQNIAGAP